MKWFRGPAGTFVTKPAGLGVNFSAVDAVLNDDLDFLPNRPGKKPPRSCSLSMLSEDAPVCEAGESEAWTKVSYQRRCQTLEVGQEHDSCPGLGMPKSRKQTDDEMFSRTKHIRANNLAKESRFALVSDRASIWLTPRRDSKASRS